MQSTTNIIPPNLEEHFGDHAQYAFTSCLRELSSNYDTLKTALKAKDISQARMMLHNMLGVSQIMGTEEVVESVKVIHGQVKEGKSVTDKSKLVMYLGEELDHLSEQLVQQRKSINLLIYTPGLLIITKGLTELSKWEYINSIDFCQNEECIEGKISQELPDIVLFPADKNHVELCDRLESQYIGSAFIKVEALENRSFDEYRAIIEAA